MLAWCQRLPLVPCCSPRWGASTWSALKDSSKAFTCPSQISKPARSELGGLQDCYAGSAQDFAGEILPGLCATRREFTNVVAARMRGFLARWESRSCQLYMGALLANVLSCCKVVLRKQHAEAKEGPQQSGHMVEVAIVTTNSTSACLVGTVGFTSGETS